MEREFLLFKLAGRALALRLARMRSDRRRLAVFGWRDAEQALEQTRHMALVREAAAGRNDLERNSPSGQLSLGALDALTHEISMRRAAEFGAEFAREMKHAEL